jgi:hypothetical protein
MLRDFTDAVRAQDWDRALRLLPDPAQNLPDHLLRSIAELRMAQQQWSEAADALERLKHRNVDAEMNRKLCRNLAALKMHRLLVYRTLLESQSEAKYSVAPSKTGHPTVFFHKPGGRTLSLSADNDPPKGIETAMRSIDAAYRGGKAIGLTGLGDGYLFVHLAANPPDLILGRQQAVCMIEPDASLVLACLMIHDYTGPTGPIEQRRISWYVGGEWLAQLRQEFFGDLFKMYPGVTIRTGLRAVEIEKQLEQFLKEIADLDRQFVDRTKPYYATLTREHLVGLLGPNPPRKPRALVMTTRFSTVLQYSAADTADAFRKHGWDTHLLIEPTAWHGLNRIAMRQAVAEFKPDLVFQIDHLRSEYQDLFPPTLPSVCWIQDNLPNLTNCRAGRSVANRDFVLIPSAQRYIANYQYPKRQCLEFRKLTRVPTRPLKWRSDGEDIVYVSNWSHRPEAVAAQVTKELSAHVPQSIIDQTCRRIIDVYAKGDSLPTPGAVRRILETVQREDGRGQFQAEIQLACITALSERLNLCLYRQQGLTWAKLAAKKLGKTISIYGNGWSENPAFAEHARGVVRYGVDLEELTRRSKLNLVLEPYVCIGHQRLLDALVAGGFVLPRAYCVAECLQLLIELLAQPEARHVRSISDARRHFAGRDRAHLEYLRAESDQADATPGRVDVIAMIRELQDSGFLPESPPLLPRFEEISFDSADSLLARLERFLNDDQARGSIAGEQRTFIESRFSYEAGVGRAIAWIDKTISSEQIQEQHAA